MSMAHEGGAGLSDSETIVLPLAGRRRESTIRSAPQVVAFHRNELNEILNVYGRQVAAGEWRDYAIDMLRDRAVFSIFRMSSEIPIYRVEKTPRLARRQGAYAVIGATGLILKRGHELKTVLRVIDKRVKLAAV